MLLLLRRNAITLIDLHGIGRRLIHKGAQETTLLVDGQEEGALTEDSSGNQLEEAEFQTVLLFDHLELLQAISDCAFSSQNAHLPELFEVVETPLTVSGSPPYSECGLDESQLSLLALDEPGLKELGVEFLNEQFQVLQRLPSSHVDTLQEDILELLP